MNNLSTHSFSTRKVLFFSTFVSQESGASHALLRTVRRVEATGFHPLLVIPDSDDSRAMFPSTDFDVVYLNIRRPRITWNPAIQGRYLASFPRMLYSIRQIIRKRNVDIVHSNEITDFVGGMAARSCSLPSVYHVRHDGIPRPYRRLLVSMLRRTSDAIIVPSNSTKAWITAVASGLAPRIRLIHDYAFDASAYQQPVSGADFRRELGVPADAILVTLVSKLVLPKGHQCFIRAAERVLKTVRNVVFVIVGGELPGRAADANAIKALARKLAPALKFAGPRSDLPAVYSASDIVVHCPVYPDTYPTVVLLPMLLGKPVIGSRIGGIPEQIEHDVTGVLVPADNAHALAESIAQLASDPGRRQRLGFAALTRIIKQLESQKQGAALEDLYNELLPKDSHAIHGATEPFPGH